MSQRSERFSEITSQEKAHYDFITRTDRKSLRRQIKNLVDVAQEFAAESLQARRMKQKKMLEEENKIYEQEFADKVKMRMEEDIKKRKEDLFKIKEESTRNEQIFLQKKRTQQNIESCYEIREMIRAKETRNLKESQLEQIVEKERNAARQRDLDKYWLNVGKINTEREEELQRQEACLQRENAMLNRRILEMQLREKEEERELERKAKRQEELDLKKMMSDLRLEELDSKIKDKNVKKQQYRDELLKNVEERKNRKMCERQEEAEMHRQLIREIQAAEAAEIVSKGELKRATHRALMEFIQYTRRMRQMEEEQRKMRDSRSDELGLLDLCTKKNLQAEAERKAEKAQECFCELRRQICEVAERRMREEIEHRENKIIENRFVHDEVPREKIHAQRIKNREDLDKQIAELKCIRLAEDKKLNSMLMKATNDPTICDELAAQYFRDGTDCLEPHPNWRILLCPKSNSDVPSVPKKDGAGDGPKLSTCTGCDLKH